MSCYYKKHVRLSIREFTDNISGSMKDIDPNKVKNLKSKINLNSFSSLDVFYKTYSREFSSIKP